MSLVPLQELGTGGSRDIARSELDHFDAIAAFAHRRAGIVLTREKAPMVLARLSKRMRVKGLQSLKDYRALLERSDAEEERRELIFSLTTNVTSFMREAHHFTTFSDVILPGIAEKAHAGRRVRFWSAGCSSGQEPYTLAMMVLNRIPSSSELDIRILATDIDARVLARAKSGIYSETECDTLPAPLRKHYLEKVRDDGAVSQTYSVRDAARSLVAFRELNLLDPWPMHGQFDAIFCRNVIIYFDRETQCKLWSRFSDCLKDDGFLFVGHSERVDTGSFPQFKPFGTTTYRHQRHPNQSSEGI